MILGTWYWEHKLPTLSWRKKSYLDNLKLNIQKEIAIVQHSFSSSQNRHGWYSIKKQNVTARLLCHIKWIYLRMWRYWQSLRDDYITRPTELWIVSSAGILSFIFCVNKAESHVLSYGQHSQTCRCRLSSFVILGSSTSHLGSLHLMYLILWQIKYFLSQKLRTIKTNPKHIRLIYSCQSGNLTPG